MTNLSSITSQHELTACRKPADEKTTSGLAGNTGFIMAAITVMGVAVLTVFPAEVTMAVDDGYYFVMRQVSSVWDLVS